MRVEDERGTDGETPGQGTASLSETVGAMTVESSPSAFIYYGHARAMGISLKNYNSALWAPPSGAIIILS